MNEAPVNVPISQGASALSKIWRTWFTELYHGSKTTTFQQQDTDPADPAKGSAVMWMNSGGDLKVKITSTAGTTKTATIIDFSTL